MPILTLIEDHGLPVTFLMLAGCGLPVALQEVELPCALWAWPERESGTRCEFLLPHPAHLSEAVQHWARHSDKLRKGK